MSEDNQHVDWAIAYRNTPYVIAEDISWNGPVHQHVLDETETDLEYIDDVKSTSDRLVGCSAEDWPKLEAPDMVAELAPEEDPRRRILTDASKPYKVERAHGAGKDYFNRCEVRDLPGELEVFVVFDEFEIDLHGFTEWNRKIIGLDEGYHVFEKTERLDHEGDEPHEFREALASTTANHQELDDTYRTDYSQDIKEQDLAGVHEELHLFQQDYVERLQDDPNLGLDKTLFTDL